MTRAKPIRVAIAGAAGRVGYSLVFRIAAGGLFGRDQPVAPSLLERDEAMPRLEACAIELKDCAYPLLTDLKTGTDSRELFQGADGVILPGGKPPSAETDSRVGFLDVNAPVMIDHGRAINRAAPTARVLVVAQPCNTNCRIAQSPARDVPIEHGFALTQLSALRAISMIGDKTGSPVARISRVTVWGNNRRTAYVIAANVA